MATITFKSEAAHEAFHDNAAGMAEVKSDDASAADLVYAERLDALVLNTAGLVNVDPKDQHADHYPLTYQIEADLVSVARIVIENVLDSDPDMASDDIVVSGGDRDAIYATNGTVGCIDCRDAIAQAIETIETAHCVEGIPDELLPMMRTLECILMQQGCEENSVGPRDGLLTSVMDVVLFG